MNWVNSTNWMNWMNWVSGTGRVNSDRGTGNGKVTGTGRDMGIQGEDRLEELIIILTLRLWTLKTPTMSRNARLS